MAKIKAIVIEQYGAAQELVLREHELAAPGRGEAQVRIAAVGVNFVDIYWRTGFDPQPLPLVPGLEAAGVVEAVGPGVDNVKPGDRVAFARQPGTYAEACVVGADSLLALPDDLSFEQGAAFPLQGLTAHYLIHDFHKPMPGEVVLIHAAAGGVGLLLVQWARHLGARVIGTVSTPEKAEAVRQAGAHDVILYTEQDFVAETLRLTDGHGADLIIDGVGKTTFQGNLQAAAIRGHIVIFGAASGLAEPISPNALMGRSLTLSGGDLRHFLQSRDELLRRANDVIDGLRAGWLKQRVFKVFPLAQAAQAHQALEGRETIGKALLSTEGLK
ncbi:quinone oxidoreductase family protein [Burkholderia gladioli]|uniref:quinone oxidoreductase family protein n=1 Tax=Burkholderia gladioli TaxID=28095 RepID=UPI001ABA7202|nr:quinone oxidoreductase [Burkholderia gladioli]